MKQPLNEEFKRMQKLAGLNENQMNENVTKKAKDFIKSNHNPGEEEDYITYEYSSSKIDPEILKYIKDNERLNVTVNGQSAAMTLKGNKVVVEFF